MSDGLPTTASCRHCRVELRGRPYHEGHFGAWRKDNGKAAKVNFYGGYVCSRECDFRASLELERTMPGHSFSKESIGQIARQSLERNWSEE